MANDITGSDVRCPRCGMVMYPEIHKNKCYLICFCGYGKDNLIKAIEKEEKHMVRTVHKPIILKETKKCKKRLKVIDIICLIIGVAFIGLIIWGIINAYHEDRNYMDNFYKRSNSTLVTVEYETTDVLFSGKAAGYIDNAVLEKWRNGEISKENITLYNPYSEEKSFTIKGEKINTIKTESYKDIYEEYDPKIYR